VAETDKRADRLDKQRESRIEIRKKAPVEVIQLATYYPNKAMHAKGAHFHYYSNSCIP